MKPKAINLIVAVQKPDNGIGLANDLLYKIKEDMAYFRETTHGSVVLMGRKTWESIPPQYRPLPDRVNIIVSTTLAEESNAKVCRSWPEAIKWAAENHPDLEIFVTGGSSLYEALLPHADILHATEIQGDRKAEIFFPDYSSWTEVSRSGTKESLKGSKYEFVVYKNSNKAPLPE